MGTGLFLCTAHTERWCSSSTLRKQHLEGRMTLRNRSFLVFSQVRFSFALALSFGLAALAKLALAFAFSALALAFALATFRR